jgi:O-antigen ligase
VELTALPGLAVLVDRALEREKLALLLVMTIVPVGALFFSASRGGIVAFVFACFLLRVLARGERIRKNRWRSVLTFAALAGAFIVWLGMSDTLERFGQLKAEGISADRRVSMYRDTCKMIRERPWMGTGLGTLVAVYPGFETHYDGRIVDHAHNDYLELLADTGIVGGLCGLAFLVLLARGGLDNWRKSENPCVRSVQAGALAGCGGILLHSLVDFNLHIPSNGLLFLLLAAMATVRLEEKPG